MNDKELLLKAKEVSQFSNESTKVGCVLAYDGEEVATGWNFNCIDDLVNSKELVEDKKERLDTCIHAEMDALYNAHNQKPYCIFNTAYVYPSMCEAVCCVECAKHLIACGVKRIVAFECVNPSETWKEQSDRALALYKKFGIKVEFIKE